MQPITSYSELDLIPMPPYTTFYCHCMAIVYHKNLPWSSLIHVPVGIPSGAELRRLASSVGTTNQQVLDLLGQWKGSLSARLETARKFDTDYRYDQFSCVLRLQV